MLVNGTVIFMIPNICRRTIPGGIAARGVTKLLSAPALPVTPLLGPVPEPGVDPGAAVAVGSVCRVLLPAVPRAVLVPPPGIKGVETRVLTAWELVKTGFELDGSIAVDDEM